MLDLMSRVGEFVLPGLGIVVMALVINFCLNLYTIVRDGGKRRNERI